MLTSTLHQAPAGTAPSAAEVDAYLQSLAAISPMAPEFTGPAPEAHELAAARGLGCVRGLRYAIAAELAAALLVYGAWRLVHLMLH